MSSWSRASSKAMWMVRDTMYLQLIKEHMLEGMTHEEAIREVDRHMPTYRLPSRVGPKILGAKATRGISKVLQNPTITVFSRYHHGVVKSMIETGKDVAAIRKGKEGTKQFLHGIDTLAAYGVALAILYPLADRLAEELTGNKNATQRRAGPFHILEAIREVTHGEKDNQALLAAVFTFNPALLMLVQLAINKQMYSGRQIYHNTDTLKQQAGDVGGYLAKQLPQAQSALRAGGDKGGGVGQFLAQQVDIKSPSAAAVAQTEKVYS